ncbi:MAG: tetratricopeptide repeat protein, partial [Nitrospirae bacterium]|nr:tetratricopeptide repeat protein [Nitrospirota bacterium]
GSRKNVGELGNSEQATRSRYKDLPTTCNLLPATSFIALASALIFAVHPFNSEVVNYISTRSSVMSGFFYMLAFYCWVRFREVGNSGSSKQVAGSRKNVGESGSSKQVAGSRKNVGESGSSKQAASSSFKDLPATYYIASLLAFLAGMLTKETVITLPVVLWLYDLYFVPLKRGGSITGHARRLAAYLPFVSLIAVAYFIVRYLYWGSFLPHFKRDLLTQLYTQMPVLTKYIRLLFIPAGLNADHYVTIYSQPTPAVAGNLILLILVIALSLWLYSSSRIEWKAVSFFILWFFIVLLPTTVMPLNAILQENRGYLAGIGFGVLAGIGLVRLPALPVLSGWSGRYNYLLPLAGLVLILIIYSFNTIQRNVVWRDGVTLWEDAVKKSPRSPASHHNLAYHYEEEGNVKLAIKEYQRAIEIDPIHAMSYYNLGRLYRGVGMSNEAVVAYKEAVKINPGYYKVYNNIGIIYNDMGMNESAIEVFKTAIKINPNYTMARVNLGKMYEKTGRLDLAAIEFEAVIKLGGRSPEDGQKAHEAARHLEWIRSKRER